NPYSPVRIRVPPPTSFRLLPAQQSADALQHVVHDRAVGVAIEQPGRHAHEIGSGLSLLRVLGRSPRRAVSSYLALRAGGFRNIRKIASRRIAPSSEAMNPALCPSWYQPIA